MPRIVKIFLKIIPVLIIVTVLFPLLAQAQDGSAGSATGEAPKPADGSTSTPAPEPATGSTTPAPDPGDVTTPGPTTTPGSSTTPGSTTTPTPKPTTTTAPKPALTFPAPISGQQIELTGQPAGDALPPQTAENDFLILLAGVTSGLGAILGGVLSLKKKKKKNKDEGEKKCLNFKKLMEEKFNELTDLKSQLSNLAKDETTKQVKDSIKNTKAEKLLALIEEGNKKYSQLKELYEKCITSLSNKKKIFFITGASGTGKTKTAENTMQDLKDANFLFFDKIGVPSEKEMIEKYGSGEQWQRIKTEEWVKKIAEEYAPKEKQVVLEGQMRPSFIVEACKKLGIENYKIILFDCADEKRNERVVERGHPELVNEKMKNWAKFLREEAGKLNLKVVDTTDLSEKESKEKLLKIML